MANMIRVQTTIKDFEQQIPFLAQRLKIKKVGKNAVISRLPLIEMWGEQYGKTKITVPWQQNFDRHGIVKVAILGAMCNAMDTPDGGHIYCCQEVLTSYIYCRMLIDGHLAIAPDKNHTIAMVPSMRIYFEIDSENKFVIADFKRTEVRIDRNCTDQEAIEEAARISAAEVFEAAKVFIEDAGVEMTRA